MMSQWAPPALISWTSSVTATGTSNEWQATPLALLGSFRVSLRPSPADGLLLGGRVTAGYDSRQEHGDDRLAHDAHGSTTGRAARSHLTRQSAHSHAVSVEPVDEPA